ncbi:hypothetical protein AB0E04_43960 [Streptomyces sp. NPDC048251]|uniref:hypothetical protein n=1 Tax=Streptomyces sp. NPDC048251 TaxID=3154501 RepID=UPI00342DA463
MFDDLPEDLPRLETLRVWHTLWLGRIDAKIAAVQQRQAETEQGRRRRPEPPDWTVAGHRRRTPADPGPRRRLPNGRQAATSRRP